MPDEALLVDFLFDPPLDDRLQSSLVDLWTEVANAGGAVGFVPPAAREDVEEVARRAFAGVTDGPDHLVVASIGDEVVGLAFLTHRPGPLFRHWATVKRLQVHPTLQGKGIGGRLLDAVHAAAVDLGLETLHLTVRGGTGTERFYESRGYRIVAEIPDVIRLRPGDDRDELYLIKRL
ncbi:MAG TPA: GNAT family N-acetyltransferase [Actinomycetota bacterium]|jgi:GNAT superfamily N-acetyltransferase|nr:GNAT family N-acetyltransferase [Actinomycetota bacterium]